MKKLTAGIFTVLLGVVAANSADAALTSKAYVDAKVKVNADAIASKADTATVNALDGRVTTAEGTIQTHGTDIADLKTNKQNKLVSTDAVVINADNTITLKNIASTGDITALQGKVDTNTANIEKNTGAITTLNGADTVENSVAYKIKNALTDYTTTTAMNEKLDLKADKTAIADMETKTNAAATYATKTEMNTVDGKFANYTNTTDMNKALDLKADKSTIGTVAEGKTVVQMIDEAKTAATYDDAAVKADIKKNTDAITTINDSEVMKSGITATKVTTYDGYADKITAAQTQADKGVEDAGKVATDLATTKSTLGLLATTQIPAACTDPNNDGCTLVYKQTGFEWELIEREGGK